MFFLKEPSAFQIYLIYIYIFGDTLGPPYMQVTIEDVQARCGEMAKFHAVIEGRPQPTVEWFKVGLAHATNKVQPK